jgi:methionyl-tRNA synthetase
MSKFYITTSLPYVNAPPHIGHALEFAQADAIARYRRAQGDSVFFLTGADEHGAKITRAAEAAKKEPQAFVDEQAEKFRALLKALNISYDDFIRTSDKKKHWPGAEQLWKRLLENGDIYKNTYKGLYCVGHEAFVTEKDLKNGVCEDHGKAPERVEEENYFFRLSEYGGQIHRHIEDGHLSILPKKRSHEALAFLAGDVEDISFSRPSKDIPWGIPVPGDGSQRMYVWCDALSNYISALGYGGSDEKFRMYWPADMHVLGKDILRFHAIIWPAMLMSAGLPLPKRLFVHGHIHTGGKKMSKTLGNIIDPNQLIETYRADAVRYVLLGAVSAFEDSDVSSMRIHEVYTADLVNSIGNFTARVSAMAEQYFSGAVNRPADMLLVDLPLKADIDVLGIVDRNLEIPNISVPWHIKHTVWPRYHAAWSEFRPDLALQEVMRLFRLMDGYIQDYEPYKLVKSDKEQASAVIWNCVYALHNAAVMLMPFMPETTRRIYEVLGISDATEEVIEKRKAYMVKKGAPLFPRIENTQ